VNAAAISVVLGSAASFLTAIAALFHSVGTRQQMNAHQADQGAHPAPPGTPAAPGWSGSGGNGTP
jgi:hypothetical protein